MLSDCSNRINQISRVNKKQEIKSPFLQQLKNFEDRLNGKIPRMRKNPSMIRSKKIKEAPSEDYL